MEGVGGEWDAVVRANGEREPVGAEGALEDGARQHRVGRGHAVTREQEAGVLIRDGERIAVDPIVSGELPFEVRGPQVVRRRRGCRHHAGMGVGAPAPPLRDQPFAHQQIARGAGGGPGEARVPRGEPGEQLHRPPVGVRPPRGTDQLRDGRGDPMRAMVRRATPIVQRPPPAIIVPGHPLVARLAADAEARAELGHREQCLVVGLEKLSPLLHGSRLQPGHRPTSLMRG
jgi:hypothetical protein